MGIYDRDYIRADRGGTPTPGIGRVIQSRIGMWSGNTWLILICVAVFAIDLFFQPQIVDLGYQPAPGFEQVDPGTLEQGQQHVMRGRRPAIPMFDPSTGQLAGFRYFTDMQPIAKYLHFSTARGFIQLEFWRFIGFQFLHANFTHLLFNMIGLFFFGPLAERYLGTKRYLAFYLLCGIFGALMYLLLNLGGFMVQSMAGTQIAIPGLLFDSPYTPLVGASAGVYGILLAGAYLAPRAKVLLFFFLPMELRTLAYLLVIVAFVSLIFRGANAGGEAGHLGGALAGFYFIRNPQHLHGFFDILGRVDPTSHHYRDKRPVGKSKGRGGPTDVEIDAVLQKVHEKGLHALDDRERAILREASRRAR